MDSHNKNNFKDNPELKILCMAPKKFLPNDLKDLLQQKNTYSPQQ